MANIDCLRQLLMATIVSLFVALAAAAIAEKCIPVRHVIDGDTIVLGNGDRIRYLGINTPEIAYGDSPGELLGDQARQLNIQLVENKDIYLEYGEHRRDRYGRHLAFVYDCRTGRFVNATLLEKGYGYLLTNGLTGTRIERMLAAQQTAIRYRRGIWETLQGKKLPVDIFGNRRSMKMHRLRCTSGGKTSRHNRVTLPSVMSGFKEGYAPCKVCLHDILK